MKIKSALKRDGFRAIQEIKDIIALQLPGIAEVTEQ
jgi:hypothetical protein